MSIAVSNVLGSILRAGSSQGLDQAALARAAGIAPETISRAKRSGNVELRTLSALAGAAGLELRAEPTSPTSSPSDAGTRGRSSLADPRWGIAWSNRDMTRQALVANALLNGAYAPILEASAEYGIDFVRAQWKALQSARDGRIAKRLRARTDRILNNIEVGFVRAKA